MPGAGELVDDELVLEEEGDAGGCLLATALGNTVLGRRVGPTPANSMCDIDGGRTVVRAVGAAEVVAREDVVSTVLRLVAVVVGAIEAQHRTSTKASSLKQSVSASRLPCLRFELPRATTWPRGHVPGVQTYSASMMHPVPRATSLRSSEAVHTLAPTDSQRLAAAW